jgi:hypothetical protein
MAASHKDREYRKMRLPFDEGRDSANLQYTSVHSEHSYASRSVCHRLTIEWSNDEGHHPATLPFFSTFLFPDSKANKNPALGCVLRRL